MNIPSQSQTMPFFYLPCLAGFTSNWGQALLEMAYPRFTILVSVPLQGNLFNKSAFLNVKSFYIDILMYILGSSPRAISPWTQALGPLTLSPEYFKSQGSEGRGPKIHRTSGPRPLGPWDLPYLGLKGVET